MKDNDDFKIIRLIPYGWDFLLDKDYLIITGVDKDTDECIKLYIDKRRMEDAIALLALIKKEDEEKQEPI